MAVKIEILFFAVVLLLLGFVPQPEDKVVFLDVGQGDSILLQNDTQQVLIDGGPGMTVLRRLGEEMPWFDRRVEVLVSTHPDKDHLEGLLHVLDRYEVGMVFLPRFAHTSQMQEAWLDRIMSKGIDYRFAWAGEKIMLDDMTITILAPLNTEEARAAAKANLNNISTVARVDFHGLSWLLTGDVERRVENIIGQNTDDSLLDVDVLKVGHHGSKTSTSEGWFAKVNPAAAVISVGQDNQFGHPSEEVRKRLEGIPVWRTDEIGSVKFLFERGEWLAPAESKSG